MSKSNTWRVPLHSAPITVPRRYNTGPFVWLSVLEASTLVYSRLAHRLQASKARIVDQWCWNPRRGLGISMGASCSPCAHACACAGRLPPPHAYQRHHKAASGYNPTRLQLRRRSRHLRDGSICNILCVSTPHSCASTCAVARHLESFALALAPGRPVHVSYSAA